MDVLLGQRAAVASAARRCRGALGCWRSHEQTVPAHPRAPTPRNPPCIRVRCSCAVVAAAPVAAGVPARAPVLRPCGLHLHLHLLLQLRRRPVTYGDVPQGGGCTGELSLVATRLNGDAPGKAMLDSPPQGLCRRYGPSSSRTWVCLTVDPANFWQSTPCSIRPWRRRRVSNSADHLASLGRAADAGLP